jgi:Zn-finger nucleic acid-binding protein
MQSPTKEGMLCPVCRVDLVMSDRQGIEIDYCPRCRGVWLDRGELDKIIERAVPEAAPARPAAPPPGYLPERAVDRGYANADMRPDDDRWGRRDERERHDDERRHGDPRRRKRSGWLGEIFDFD